MALPLVAVLKDMAAMPSTSPASPSACRLSYLAWICAASLLLAFTVSFGGGGALEAAAMVAPVLAGRSGPAAGFDFGPM